jgi:hypothetical protein
MGRVMEVTRKKDDGQYTTYPRLLRELQNKLNNTPAYTSAKQELQIMGRSIELSMADIIDAHTKAIDKLQEATESLRAGEDAIMDDDVSYNKEVIDARMSIVVNLRQALASSPMEQDLPRLSSQEEFDNDMEEMGYATSLPALSDEDDPELAEDGGGGYVEQPELEQQVKDIRQELGLPPSGGGLGDDENQPYKRRRLLDPVTAAKYARSTRSKFNGIWGGAFDDIYKKIGVDDPQKAGVIGGTQWYLNHLATQHSGDYPSIPGTVPLMAFPRGRRVGLFDPIKKSMKAHGMLRPANEFRQRTGMYSRIDDLLKVVPERYQSVIDGRQGPLQDAEVEIEKLMGLNNSGDTNR